MAPLLLELFKSTHDNKNAFSLKSLTLLKIPPDQPNALKNDHYEGKYIYITYIKYTFLNYPKKLFQTH